jgi:hypothetical protein
MKQYARPFLTGVVLAGISFGVTACQQAPAPVAAAPADTTAPAPPPPVVVEEHPRVVEEVRPRQEDRARVGVNVDIHKQQDKDHVAVDIHAHP